MICPICQQPCKPKPRPHRAFYKTCGSAACRFTIKSQASKRSGMWRQATAESRRARAERWQRLLVFEFGRLSERELAIVRAVSRTFYNRGFAKAAQRHAREAA